MELGHLEVSTFGKIQSIYLLDEVVATFLLYPFPASSTGSILVRDWRFLISNV